jgi:hypothetical protein
VVERVPFIDPHLALVAVEQSLVGEPAQGCELEHEVVAVDGEAVARVQGHAVQLEQERDLLVPSAEAAPHQKRVQLEPHGTGLPRRQHQRCASEQVELLGQLGPVVLLAVTGRQDQPDGVHPGHRGQRLRAWLTVMDGPSVLAIHEGSDRNPGTVTSSRTAGMNQWDR